VQLHLVDDEAAVRVTVPPWLSADALLRDLHEAMPEVFITNTTARRIIAFASVGSAA
jgi:hypothetical protein